MYLVWGFPFGQKICPRTLYSWRIFLTIHLLNAILISHFTLNKIKDIIHVLEWIAMSACINIIKKLSLSTSHEAHLVYSHIEEKKRDCFCSWLFTWRIAYKILYRKAWIYLCTNRKLVLSEECHMREGDRAWVVMYLYKCVEIMQEWIGIYTHIVWWLVYRPLAVTPCFTNTLFITPFAPSDLNIYAGPVCVSVCSH